MRHLGIFFVRLYQKLISPLKPPSCRFTPTCSQYAIEAFREWGFFCGLALAIWRILRCNPFSKGGEDPVPLRKRHRKDAEISQESKGESSET